MQIQKRAPLYIIRSFYGKNYSVADNSSNRQSFMTLIELKANAHLKSLHFLNLIKKVQHNSQKVRERGLQIRLGKRKKKQKLPRLDNPVFKRDFISSIAGLHHYHSQVNNGKKSAMDCHQQESWKTYFREISEEDLLFINKYLFLKFSYDPLNSSFVVKFSSIEESNLLESKHSTDDLHKILRQSSWVEGDQMQAKART
ncbi:hypothetical protein SUGI_0439840 [Cryptomeria japonica]|nr:hypothetical protein SUGI_0439840 [Cryptomeria japonica]